MIPSVAQNSPDGTQHVPDGSTPVETHFVPDGPTPVETQFVPDGPAPTQTQSVPDPIPTHTQFVPDGPAPTHTQFVPDGPTPTHTQFVPDGPAAAAARSPDQTQHVADLPRFGRFRALAELGSGAMGTVYRAHDDVLGRSVAIKALHTRDSGTRERFLREARAIGAVLHPNILAVYDAGTDDRTPYLVMELAAAGSLRERIKAGPLPIETVREVGIQIARALAAAHAANILHRDVKPANILCANDVWKLADFGIARLPDSTLTVEGQFLGSPSYAAPESLRAGQFSPASDIYGLGATLYEAVTGSPPHGDHEFPSLIRKLEQDPPPVRTHRAVPAPLEHAIMATLARDPARRPSAEQLAHMLAVTSAGPAHEPQPVHTGPSARTKALALALAGVAIILVVLAITRDRPAVAADVQPMFDPRTQVAKPQAADSLRDEPARGDPRDESTDPRVEADPSGEPDPRHEPDPRDEAADPWFAQPPGESERAVAPEAPLPTIVDEYGNPVDEETARKILEQMERDARSEYEDIRRGRGRGKWKRRDH